MLFQGLLLSLWLAAAPTAGAADDPPVVRLLALSSASATAVVAGEAEGAHGANGALHVVRPGQEIGETGLTLIQVLPDRIEVRQRVSGGAGTLPRERRLWIYRADGAGPSRVQVLDRAAPVPPRRATPLGIHGTASGNPGSPSSTVDDGPSEPSGADSEPDSRSGRPASAPGEVR